MTTREKILQSSLKLFNEKGYNEVGVREIARSLDISPGNLSYHFSRKEDIFFELMRLYSQNNNRYFEQFFTSEPTLDNYLILMRHMLRSQYQHRGLFMAISLFYNEAQLDDRLEYQHTYEKREKGVKNILASLIEASQISLNEDDIQFMFSFLTLFGRFSIVEAFMLDKNREEDDILHHYLSLLIRQFSFFATEEGISSINEFRQNFLIPKRK